MNMPSESECYLLLAEFKTPANVVRHSEQCAKVAALIASKLKAKGIDVDVEFVRVASLLHDLVKYCDMKEVKPFPGERDFTPEEKKYYNHMREKYQGMKHGEAACRILTDKYPEIARAIDNHEFSAVKERKLKKWEDKIVYYADKRVAHDRIVALRERQREAETRYPPTASSRRIWKAVGLLEKEMFDIIGEDADKITGELT